MNVVDSCGWLEYFGDGPNATFFSDALAATSELIVPSMTIYEVFKRIIQQRDEGDALQAVAMMQQGRVVELSSPLALSAARLSLEYNLPMADSIILATARAHGATLWTQDVDFESVLGVRYIAKDLDTAAG
ncbi:MAG: type II toxin-antitoxin system VapC family toxin [Actinobacteria bacterium]|nr:type II toxin-antitoxin system VapC family toxin [Actinomycetota bacterium]